MVVLAYLLFVSLVAFFGWRLGRNQPVIRYFAATFALFYGLRATILVFHLDTAEPPELFQSLYGGAPLAEGLLIISLFLAMTALGYLTVHGSTRTRLQVFCTRPLDVRRMTLLLVLLSVAAAIVTVVLLVRFGSTANIIRAGKITKQLAGVSIFRGFAEAGAFLGAALLIEMRKGPAVPGRAALVVALTLLNTYFVYLWGTRTVAVIVVATVIIGDQASRRAGKARRAAATRGVRSKAQIARIVLAALGVVCVAMFLRTSRADTVYGSDPGVVGANFWRQVSLSTNAVYLDATVLAIQDDGHLYEYPRGVDFVSGLRALVPGFIWSGKNTENPGLRFKRLYYPTAINGWPVGGPTSWYLNFGLVGVVIGAYLSGLVLRLLVNAWRLALPNAFNTLVALMSVAFVLQLGFTSETPLHAVAWWVPLLIVGRLIQTSRRGGQGLATLADRDLPGKRPPVAAVAGRAL
jgi:hypothetical protein